MAREVIESQEVTTGAAPVRTVRTVRSVGSRQPGERPEKDYETKKTIFRFYQFIWYILGVIEILLAFRVGLKVLAANPLSPFARFIYSTSDLFALPFSGVVAPTSGGNAVLEWSTLIAMGFYAILAFGLVELFQLIKPTNPEEVENTVDNV